MTTTTVVICAAMLYFTQTEAAVSVDTPDSTQHSGYSLHDSLVITNLPTKVSSDSKSAKSTHTLSEKQAKPQSIFKKRTKRWNANLLALTLYDRSPEIRRPVKQPRVGQTVWAYDFGGGVWGRRKRDIEDSNFDFEF